MFAKKLRDLRKQKDVTQIALAQELGLSQQTVARWESGAATPHFDTISRISKFFGVPMSDFVECFAREDAYKLLQEKHTSNNKKLVLLDDLLHVYSYHTTEQDEKSIVLIDSIASTVFKTAKENEDFFETFDTCLRLLVDIVSIASIGYETFVLQQTLAQLTGALSDADAKFDETRTRTLGDIKSLTLQLSESLMLLPDALFSDKSKSKIDGTYEEGDPNGKHNTSDK